MFGKKKYCTIDCAIERANCRLSYPDFGGILRWWAGVWWLSSDGQWLMADGPCVLFVWFVPVLVPVHSVCGWSWITQYVLLERERGRHEATV